MSKINLDMPIETLEEMKVLAEVANFQGAVERQVAMFQPKGKKLIGIANVSPEGASYTDGRRVVVGYGNMMLGYLPKRISTIGYALTLHELFHNYFSSFTLFKEFIDNVSEDFAADFKGTNKYNHAKQVGVTIAKFINNGIEDGRIEFLGVYVVPGAKKLLEGLRAFWWDEQPLTNDMTLELNDFLFSIVSHATMRVMPKGFYDKYEAGYRIYEEFDKIQTLVERASRANDAKSHVNFCYEIYEIMKPYALQLFNETPDMNLDDFDSDFEGAEGQETGDSVGADDTTTKSGKSNNGEDDQKDEKESSSDDKSNSDKLNQDNESKEKEDDDKSKSSQNDDKSNDKSDDSKENKKESKSNMEKALEEAKKMEEKLSEFQNEENKMENDLKREIKKAEENAQQYEPQKDLSKEQEEMCLEEYQASGGYSDSLSNIYFSKNHFMSTKLPTKLALEGKKVERLMEKILKKRNSHRRNHLNKGRINTRQLWSTHVGNKDIFYKEKKKEIKKTVGYLLIDGSGSMSGGKQKTAVEAASILEKGLKNLIPLKITQFTTSSGTVHKIIKGFDQNIKNVDFVWQLQDKITPTGGNADGHSIRVATQELLNRPENERILTIISDGLPSDYQSYEAGLKDVKEAVLYAKSKGIKVISLFIGHKGDKEQVQEQFKFMYGDSVLFTDNETLSRNLVQVYKRIMI